MGFISSITRSMRGNKPSQKLSTTKADHLDEDSNDLIKTTSNTASHNRGESIESTSTTVHHSTVEPVLPTESPAQREQLSPADLNIQTLFDNGRALDVATNRAVKAFTMPEYPVLKLDTTPSPSDTPRKKLEAPLDLGEKMGCNKSKGEKTQDSWEENGRKDTASRNNGSSRLKRSMTGLWKSYSLKMERSPLSMRKLRSSAAPSWFDASSLAEEACLVDEKEEKWLEARGIRGGRDIGHWSGDAMGRAW